LIQFKSIQFILVYEHTDSKVSCPITKSVLTHKHIQKTQQTDTLVLTNIYENTFLLLLQ